MKLIRNIALSALLATACAEPAKAALIVDRSGSVQDIFDIYNGESDFVIGFRNLIGPNTIGPPFSTPSVYDNGGPADPWVYSGPLMHYVFKLTTDQPLGSPRYEAVGAEYYNIYEYLDGTFEYTGGNDNSGGAYETNACEFGIPAFSHCMPAQQTGTTTIFSFDAQQTASWDGYRAEWFWFNYAEFYADLPIDALDGNYHLQIFASAVPEPATWVFFILGFGIAGCLLRRSNSSRIQRINSAPTT
jgi:hypothetical protein